LTKKSVVTVSNSFVGIQNEFNKILGNITEIKSLQAQERNTTAIAVASNDNNSVATRIIGVDQLSDRIDGLSKYFEALSKLLKKLDLKTPESVQPEDRQPETDQPESRQPEAGGDIDVDIDINKKRGKKSIGMGRRVGGKSLVGAAVGVVGAIGAGYLASKAYDAVSQPPAQKVPTPKPLAQKVPSQKSSTDKRLESAVKTANAAPAKREPSEISNNSYSSRFASYLSDVFQNIKGYVSGLAGAAVGAAAGIVGGGGTVTQPNLSGQTDQTFQSIMDIAASMGAPRPEIVAAQWDLESGRGTSRIARELNNLFGQTTNNPADGESVRGTDGVTRIFKRFATPEDSIRFNVDRWNKRYTNRDQTPEQAIGAILQNRYAGDPDGSEARRYYGQIAGILARNNISYRQVYTYTPAPTSVSSAPSPQAQGGAGFISPIAGGTGGGYGMRRHPILGITRMHNGLDFRAAYGTPVLASSNGTVSFVGEKRGFGHIIEIDHGRGIKTRYAHLSRFRVANGAVVSQGQHIGDVGSSGLSTGAHLHFEVRLNGRAENPSNYINVPTAAPTAAPATPMSNPATPTRQSLIPNRRRGNGNVVVVASGAPAQPTISFPYRFGQTPPRQPTYNSRGLYMAYHGQ
jgi:murein DD-endopeptidase MepM/ murein hydrolase activator NlpD